MLSEPNVDRGMKALIYAGGFSAIPAILSTPVFGGVASLHDAQEFANVLDRVGSEIATAHMTPGVVQQHFGKVFDRTDVLARYRTVLSAAAHGQLRRRGGEMTAMDGTQERSSG